MKLLIIDNYDSFTFNLCQLFGELGAELVVKRNDEITSLEAGGFGAEAIIISPGPGTPDDAGVSRSVISEWAGKIPILGVCLGMQCIAEVFGGKVRRAEKVMHGKTSLIHHDGRELFENVPDPAKVARYHSLVTVDYPECLRRTAWTDDGVSMALRHEEFPVWGVQFHPESFLTDHGGIMMQNFLDGIADHALAISSRPT